MFLPGPDDRGTWFLVDRGDPEQGGTAAVLFVDDEWLCVDWKLRGETRGPEGTYEISGIVLTRYETRTLPLRERTAASPARSAPQSLRQ